MACVTRSCTVGVTIFSTDGKFWQISSFIELQVLTQATCSYVLLQNNVLLLVSSSDRSEKLARKEDYHQHKFNGDSMAFYTQTEISLRRNMPAACDDETMTGTMKWDKQLKDNRTEF